VRTNEEQPGPCPAAAERTALPRPRARGGRRIGTAAVLLILALAAPGFAQTRRAPRPSPTPEAAAIELGAVTSELKEARNDIAALRGEIAALDSRLSALEALGTDIKGIAEPMREEVRGLYVETSNVRSEIARLEQTNTANTDALGKSRYVLTLLLVATAVLQLVVLAVLLRSR
jgi:septal ring factor EnvC (AmiA/AmiB activator)